jgi:hypothetical protein
MNSFDPEPLLPVQLTLDDRPGPAPRVSRERAAAMIDAALVDFDGVQASNQRALQRGRLLPTLAIAASVLLGLVGAAAAARFYFHFADDTHAPPPAQATTPAALHARHAEPSPVVAPAPEPESPVDVQLVPLRAASKPARANPAERNAPEDLMQKANRLRAIGQFREASQTYGLVYDRFPRSLSAYVARIAAAAIELEHLSNPTLARHLFEQALREQPAGALDLEARQGLSVALRDLEDRPAEVRALQSLVSAHPDSPAARRAQVRLREIDGSAP